MLNQSTTRNETGVPATGRRRRLGVWLIVGWLAFWLTTAAHPFELCFRGGPDQRLAVTASTTDGYASRAERAPGPAPDDSHCPDVSAITIGAASAATVKGDRVDPVFPPPSSLIPVTHRDRETRNLKTYFPAPSSSAPLYLRTQRLLI